jgi:hypothetical protein
MTAQSDAPAATPQKSPHVPAAFINAIADEGTKAEAIQYLQETWNDYCAIKRELAASGETVATLREELAEARACIRDFAVIAGLHDKPDATITIRQGLKVWTDKHAEAIKDAAIDAARTK